MEWIVVKTLLSLTAVVGLMIAVVYVMKRFMLGGQAATGAAVEMRVIGTLTLQPKRSIAVVKVMNKVLIVGMSEEGMQTLGEITDAESLETLEAKLEAASARPKWNLRSRGAAATGSVSFVEALGVQIAKLTAKGSQ